MAEKKSGSKGKAGGRHALGRGLGALIPSQVNDDVIETSSGPLDVLFPGSTGQSGRARGGSKRDLLQPKPNAKQPQTTKPRPRTAKASEAENSSTPAPQKAAETSGRKRMKEAVTSAVVSSSAVRSETPRTQRTESVPATYDTDTQVEVSRPSVSRETSDELVPVPGAVFAEISVDRIIPNSRQPREVFDEDELAELSASIREVGVLQPLVVREIDVDGELNERLAQSLKTKPDAQYELIMGERRLRASELAGMETVPAIIRHTEDADLLRDALLENLHRAQLNPLEEASAYQQLMADFGATQEELSRRIARSRPQIANTLRLLKLPPMVQKKVAAQVISAGHARALLSLENPHDMEVLADRIVAEGLSVRTTEELVRLGRVKSASRPRTRSVPTATPLGESIIAALQDIYDTRVTITEGAKKGRIIIEFAGTEDLQRIADIVLER